MPTGTQDDRPAAGATGIGVLAGCLTVAAQWFLVLGVLA